MMNDEDGGYLEERLAMTNGQFLNWVADRLVRRQIDEPAA